MASFFDSVKKSVQDVSNKTGDAIETQKLNMKINSEKKAIEAGYTKLGEYLWSKINTEEVAKDETLQAICNEIQGGFDNIAAAEAEIQNIKDKAAAAASAAAATAANTVAAGSAFCPNCGTPVVPGSKFCGGCGAKIG